MRYALKVTTILMKLVLSGIFRADTTRKTADTTSLTADYAE